MRLAAPSWSSHHCYHFNFVSNNSNVSLLCENNQATSADNEQKARRSRASSPATRVSAIRSRFKCFVSLIVLWFFNNFAQCNQPRASHMPSQACRGRGPLRARGGLCATGAHTPSKCPQYQRSASSRHRQHTILNVLGEHRSFCQKRGQENSKIMLDKKFNNYVWHNKRDRSVHLF